MLHAYGAQNCKPDRDTQTNRLPRLVISHDQHDVITCDGNEKVRDSSIRQMNTPAKVEGILKRQRLENNPANAPQDIKQCQLAI